MIETRIEATSISYYYKEVCIYYSIGSGFWHHVNYSFESRGLSIVDEKVVANTLREWRAASANEETTGKD